MTTPVPARAAMLSRLLRLGVAAGLFAAAVLGLLATPSSAGVPPGEPPAPLARLELTITPVDQTITAAPRPSSVILTCTPDGGTHPSPKAACNALRSVGGDFRRLPNVPGVSCPQFFAPVVAHATGRWQSSPTGPVRFVDYSETFSNRCFAAVGTNNVFNF